MITLLKKFKDWISIKEKIHINNRNTILFKEGEVWWCAIGENVGIEINGKSEVFSRPVAVYKKLSSRGFMAIPMSTQLKQGSWYVPISFQAKQVVLNISQARVMSTERMYSKIGELDDTDMKLLEQQFIALYSHNK